MRALVLGAGGQVGAALLRALASRGHAAVAAPSRSPRDAVS
ncbi:MAG: sugar nucleotide-binding protein, partial [Candidatus Rokubacteria bacterium]|nr:sugar nucleotide-binding protein [Candidatus Rokubacteria bacterium]